MQLKPPVLSYRLLSTFLLPFWIAHAFIHSLKNHNFQYLRQRLGIHKIDKGSKLWIHASSVGEIEVIKPIVDELSKNHAILVTTFTATGFKHALDTFNRGVNVAVIPIDWWPISRYFAKSLNIKLTLIAETELWPELLFQIKVKRIPLLLINARLTPKTMHQKKWMRRILQNTLNYFDQILTRNQLDVDNFESMGKDKNQITLCGNLKFIQTEPTAAYPRLIERPYIIFASTHEAEELLFAKIVESLQLYQLVVIAPRHPNRARKIISDLKLLNLDISQRSKDEIITDETDIYLADTLGELKNLMAHADLVVMGGSFANYGGHNVLEPANLGKVIITGPSDEDITAEVSLLLEADAIVQVKNSNELKLTIQELITNKPRMRELGHNAKAVINKQRHVLDNYLKIIQEYL